MQTTILSSQSVHIIVALLHYAAASGSPSM